jgi:hypothetical protein
VDCTEGWVGDCSKVAHLLCTDRDAYLTVPIKNMKEGAAQGRVRLAHQQEGKEEK